MIYCMFNATKMTCLIVAPILALSLLPHANAQSGSLARLFDTGSLASSGSQPEDQGASDSKADVRTLELLAALNNRRENLGLPILTLNKQLSKSAQEALATGFQSLFSANFDDVPIDWMIGGDGAVACTDAPAVIPDDIVEAWYLNRTAQGSATEPHQSVYVGGASHAFVDEFESAVIAFHEENGRTCAILVDSANSEE